MMYTMSLRFEADIYFLLHAWYNSVESEVEDIDNSKYAELSFGQKRVKFPFD